MTDETQETIDDIMKAITSGDYGSKGQMEKVQEMVNNLYSPAVVLEDQRYAALGESLYVTTHLGAKRSILGDERRQSLPILRADVDSLASLLTVLQRLGILESVLKEDYVIRRYLPNQQTIIFRMVKDIEESSAAKRVIVIQALSGYLAHLLSDLMAEEKNQLNAVQRSISLPATTIAWIRQNTDSEGNVDYRAMGKYFYDMRKEGDANGTSAALSIMSGLFRWSTEPSLPRKSQKARGIQAMSGDDYPRTHWLWQVKPSMFLSLEDSTQATASELMASMRVAFGAIKDVFKTGIFIRTCPASPRPGALENVKAHTPAELLKGIRYLGRGMLDEDCADYDPEGCLCVMPFIPPSCSAVAVVGHNEIVMGPSFDGVTAGGGSNVIIPIAQELAIKMRHEVENMGLGDGMDNHEIELVWNNDRYPGGTIPIKFKRAVQNSGYDKETLPIITQVRGLHEAKVSLTPPPVVDGETLTVRGNIPDGVVEQQTHINVGSGDLSECINLEQLAEKGELPDGLVVYAPSGSSNAHVAGVGIQWDIPVIYGILPRENGTVWTEISGWVTDIEGAEPTTYKPSALKEFFFMGCNDGDKHWDYGYHVLSQFFHTYLTGPRNDPRFEAYLGGFYSAWILKATLAVAMGEVRHAYGGNKAKMHPVHGAIHSYVISALAGESDLSLGGRGTYYNLLKNKPVGMHNLMLMLSCYERLFNEPNWPSSYGGNNYYESVNKATKVASTLDTLMNTYYHPNTEEELFKRLLGEINTLENAVHNCAFFFNKFVANKKWFDIGTSHHSNTSKLEHQYHVVSALQYHFYTEIDEPHHLSSQLVEYHHHWTTAQYNEGLSSKYQLELPDVLDYLSLCDIDDNLEAVACDTMVEAVDRFRMQGNVIHHLGTCTLHGCDLVKCQELQSASEWGLTGTELAALTQLLGKAPKPFGFMTPIFTPVSSSCMESVFNIEIDKEAGLVYDSNATIFTDTERHAETSGQTWTIDAEKMRFVPHWSLRGKHSLLDWGEVPVFIGKKCSAMYPQKQVNLFIEILNDALSRFDARTLITHFFAILRMEVLDGGKEQEVMDYCGKHDFSDVARTASSFLRTINVISQGLFKFAKTHPVIVAGDMSRTDVYTDWRKWTTRDALLWALMMRISNATGQTLHLWMLPTTDILKTFQIGFGNEFVKEVLQQ